VGGLLIIILNLNSALRSNAAVIVHYAFTEMLNNAIEHSRSDGARLRVRLDAGRVFFEIRDHGIGVFYSITEKFGLTDEHAAMVELLKGRTTTMPGAHTGAGIFFTSRSADRFVLRSHWIRLE
jgi:anti-sigma regulatory factor (Ser/Thr protein kinase)